MENPSEDVLRGIVAAVAVTVGLVAVTVVATVWRAAARTGPARAIERRSAWRRRLTLTAVALASSAVVIQWDELPGAWAAVALAAAAALFALSPASDDAAVGEAGVRSGWETCTFDELQEWRLTGEHLRWRVTEEWRACRVPGERLSELRARLESACPQRESRFKD